MSRRVVRFFMRGGGILLLLGRSGHLQAKSCFLVNRLVKRYFDLHESCGAIAKPKNRYAFGSGATLKTTYNKQPPAGPSPPSPPAVLRPGHSYVINVGGCAIETGMAGLEVSGMLCSTDTIFSYLQSEKNCPIGFYVAIS